MTITTEFTLDENQYISDLAVEVKHKLTHLNAPTGRGKTTFIVNELSKQSKIIMVCPVNIQVRQLASDFAGNPKVQCITKDDKSNSLTGDIIICVYDQLAQLLDSGLRGKHYTLVIDEAHKVYQAADYRSKALSVLVDAISDDTFKQVLTVSATFQRDIFPFTFDEVIDITHEHNQKSSMEIIFHKKKKSMDKYLLSTAPSQGKISIIRLNNKEQIKHAKLCFEQQNLRVFEIHSDNQKSPEVQRFLDTSLVGDYDIVLTTSLLDEAINIKNTNIESVHIYHKLHCDEVNQFIGRNRKSQPLVQLHLLNSELNRKDIDVHKERRELEDLSDIALTYCMKLVDSPNKLSRVVDNLNETNKFCQGFEPLLWDYREGGDPTINKISILAKLYDISMEVQYINDATLRFALLRTNCFSEVEIFDCEDDETQDIERIIESATNQLSAVRLKAIEESALEIGVNQEAVDDVPIVVVEELAKKYRGVGIKGDVTKEWFNLCLILSATDALDAVKNNRTAEIWAFQKAIEHFIHLKPVFNVLIEDLKKHGQVRLIGSDAINEYFLLALRKTAKEQKGFKKLVKKLKVNGLEVLENNKFKVTSRFTFKFIRSFTDGEITRSGNVTRCVINTVGKYGYSYRIRTLRSSLRIKYLRNRS